MLFKNWYWRENAVRSFREPNNIKILVLPQRIDLLIKSYVFSTQYRNLFHYSMKDKSYSYS